MARTDNLTNYLTDVATAIKEKKGDNTPIKASEFDTEIANLQTGGDVSEYFETTITGDNNEYFIHNVFKKLPPIEVETKDLSYAFNMYKGTIYPELDTSEVTNFSYFFNANSTNELPLYDTSSAKRMDYFMNTCTNITTFPLYDTSNVTNFESFCSNCTNLLTVPQINTSKATSVKGMFANNSKLTTIPELDFGSVTNIQTILQSCSVLTTLGGFKNLGKAYLTTASQNYGNYQLTLSMSPKLTEQSIINVLNGLYDIASKGCKTQRVYLGSTNLARLTSEAGIQAKANAEAKGWLVN